MNKEDIVGQYIELREQAKEIDEKVKALELVILDSYRDDNRIKIFAGRKSYIIKPSTYETLSAVGIETEVVERRLKKLEEFDIDVQKSILNNKENYEEKITKESVRII